METTTYFVYVLQNVEGRLYIGFTTDLERRVQQHQNNEGGWTRTRGPWQLVYCETFANRIEAMHRERNLKRGKTNKELRTRISNQKDTSLVKDYLSRSPSKSKGLLL